MYRFLVLVCCVHAVSASKSHKSPKSPFSKKYIVSIEFPFKPRIIGGNTIDIEDAPYQVSIYDAVHQRHHCGGSIVSRNYILTAGHCGRLVPQAYRIRVGSSKSLEGGQFINVIAVIKHEDFIIDGIMPLNDIALLRVVPPISIDNKTTAIVELAGQGEKFIGRQAMLSGWGQTTEKGKLAEHLQGLPVKILSRETCDRDYLQLHQGIRDGQICAEHRDKNKDLCNGDSGSPLVVDGKQVGIVSWSGPGCALPDRPGVYTEVAAYRDWIDEHIKF